MLLTTANSIPGFEHYEVISIVGAEAAIGINIFKDITTAVRDIIGGRSKAVQDALKQGRSLCMQELKQEAFDVGADAVIGVDFDYSELSGGSGGLFLAVTGTAIKLSK
ncbi:hypothetical protein BA939_23755 [Rhizobium sp. S41]|nr:hypothetical protein BA939_23755 [Rhizobium sp. S41]KGE80386.1 hypothetical protein LW14_23175 [Rhizobium sp. H41]